MNYPRHSDRDFTGRSPWWLIVALLCLSAVAEVQVTVQTMPGLPLIDNAVVPVLVQLDTPELLDGELHAQLGGDGGCAVRVKLNHGQGRYRYRLSVPVVRDRLHNTLTVEVRANGQVLGRATKDFLDTPADWHMALLAPAELLQQTQVPPALQISPDDLAARLAPLHELEQAAVEQAEVERTARRAAAEAETNDDAPDNDYLIFAPVEEAEKDPVELAPIRQSWQAGNLQPTQLAALARWRRGDEEAETLLLEIASTLWRQGEERLQAGAAGPAVLPLVKDVRLIKVPDTTPLPDQWHGYQPIDVFVWQSPAEQVLAKAQLEALRTWIQRGGRLVLLDADEQVAESLGLTGESGFGSVEIRRESWPDLQQWPRGELLALLGCPPDRAFTREHLLVVDAAIQAAGQDYAELTTLPVGRTYLNPPQRHVDVYWHRGWWVIGCFALAGLLLPRLLRRWLRPRRRLWLLYLLLVLGLTGGIYRAFYHGWVASTELRTLTVTDATDQASRSSVLREELHVRTEPTSFRLGHEEIAIPYKRSSEERYPDAVLVPKQGLFMQPAPLRYAAASRHAPPERTQVDLSFVRLTAEGNDLLLAPHMALEDYYVIWRHAVYAPPSSLDDTQRLRMIGLANGLFLGRPSWRPDDLLTTILHETLNNQQAARLKSTDPFLNLQAFGPWNRWPALADDQALLLLKTDRLQTTRLLVPVSLPGEAIP